MRPKDGYRGIIRRWIGYGRQKAEGLLGIILSSLDPIIDITNDYNGELRKFREQSGSRPNNKPYRQ